MIVPPDYTDEYKNKIRPEINRRLRNLLLSFIGCVIFLIATSAVLDYFGLPDKLIFILFFACAAFYLYQINCFTNIKCPNCKKSLFVLSYIRKTPLTYKGYVSKHCTHCGVRLR